MEGNSDGAFGEMKSRIFLIEMLITELPKNSATDTLGRWMGLENS